MVAALIGGARKPAEVPGGVFIIVGGDPQGATRTIEAGPLDPFNHSFSIVVECDDQAEIDRLWDALLEGGAPERCGWLRDRWGLCWQIAPKRLGELMDDPDREEARRVTEAMLGMVKLDIAALETAARAGPS